MASEGKISLYSWKYSHYFQLQSKAKNNILVTCKLCPGSKILSTANNSNSNLLKHLEKRHASTKLVAKVTSANAASEIDSSEQHTPTPPKQQRLEFERRTHSQAQLDKTIARYVVENMLPISTVEDPAFRQIVSMVPCTGGTQQMGRKTFSNYLEREYAKMENELKKAYEELHYISTTADIWSIQNRSYLGWGDVFSKKLLVPCTTRWNSFHDAVARITEIPLNDLITICDRLGLKCFSDRELQFLKEYCAITKPLTVALDILQGEDNCYYGTLLPTLEVLMAKTLEKKEGLTVAMGLPDAIVQAIKTRFAAVLEKMVAAASLPMFKLRWCKDQVKKDMVKGYLVAECHKVTPQPGPVQQPEEPTTLTPSTSKTHDFFNFGEDDDTFSSVESEIISYLRTTETEMDVLQQFPTIKEVSLKKNAATPSSAPVERLFSLGSLGHQRLQAFVLMDQVPGGLLHLEEQQSPTSEAHSCRVPTTGISRFWCGDLSSRASSGTPPACQTAFLFLVLLLQLHRARAPHRATSTSFSCASLSVAAVAGAQSSSST
ncbi:hypothetical protein N1851_014370 [Merluccius polli]|uniref:BED-type domain-containing protein n=1 Tax=Merluccius polli TaxID=89951 RepID=A0AA47MTG4_MERPO|nr:hypothetical protein N1851_014370 [Merluccius polli]